MSEIIKICGTCRYDLLGTPYCIDCHNYVNWEPVKREMTHEDKELAKWMSVALSDPSVCSEMQEDVRNWLESFDHE